MSATQNDIESWFKVLREVAAAVAGADQNPQDREMIKVLAEAGLRIAESVVVDLNLIAWHLGELVDIERHKR